MRSAASTAVSAEAFLQQQERWLRTRLNELRRKRGEGGAIRALTEARGEPSSDFVEQAVACAEQEIAGAFFNGAHADYEAVLAGLNKITEKRGQYGNCEECGESMTQRRLRAVPAARFCVPCQDRIDTMMGTSPQRSRRG